MSRPSLPTRAFRGHTDLDQLKRQAKELLGAFRAGAAAAVTEVNAHYRDADAATFALHDAQLVLARAYGFESWRKLKACVDGVNARRMVEAVRAGDLETVRAMLRARPELVNMGLGERLPIHYAVVNRSSEMTRLLMRHGADARAGVHPHRDATTAHTIAGERGCDEIVAIIREEEQRRIDAQAGRATAAAPGDLFLVANWESGRALEMLKADPALIHSAGPNGGTPLHAAACELHEQGVAWLLDHGADPNRRAKGTWTPIELAAVRRGWDDTDHPARFKKVARLLLNRGAELGPFSAVALGDADWIRARHAQGSLGNPAATDHYVGHVGLVEAAVWHERREIVALLLDLGLDPDERTRVRGRTRSSTPRADRYSAVSSSATGGWRKYFWPEAPTPTPTSLRPARPCSRRTPRRTGRSSSCSKSTAASSTPSLPDSSGRPRRRSGCADEAAGRLRPGAVSPGKTVAEDLLWTAAGGGDTEILRMALERLDLAARRPPVAVAALAGVHLRRRDQARGGLFSAVARPRRPQPE